MTEIQAKEASIFSHAEKDYRMERNYMKGFVGDIECIIGCNGLQYQKMDQKSPSFVPLNNEMDNLGY